MPPEDREITKVKGSNNAVVVAASLPAKDLPVSLGNKNKTININLSNDPKVNFPPAVNKIEPEQTGFLPNVGKFFSDCSEGLKKAIGYVPNIPESIVYVVALNVPSVLRAAASLIVIPAKCVSALFSSEKFDFGKILKEEKEAILMIEPKSRWINAVRGFCNKYIPGGSLLGEDEVFSRTGDEKLKEIINPLNNISKAIVEPLTTPLHEVSQGLTDRVTYIGYNIYLHYSKEKSLSYSYPEFLKEVEDEKNWHLRMGRTAIYTVEAVAIAYYCGGAGAKSKLEALKRTSDFLKMPVVMTALQTAGSVLKREDIQELTTKQIIAEVLTEIPKGVFDSAVFMLPISKISQYRIERGINKLNQQMLASSTSAKLPIPIGQYQADVNKLVARTQAWSELFDFAEGMPDAQTKGVELKDCLVQLAYNPFSATNWRLTGATALEFTSSALDLVDAKHNKGHQESLHSVSENAQSNVDESLKANTYELAGGIEEVQQYFRDYHYRKLSIQGVESVLSYFGITTLSSKDQLRKEIEQRSKSVYAFYDGERDVIFAPKLPEDASTNQKQLHQSFVQHEEFHRRVAHHQEGIVGVLSEEPILKSFIEQRIFTNLQLTQEQSLNSFSQTTQGKKQLEEYAATSYQVIHLENQGINQYSESLINSCINQDTLDFIPGVFAANEETIEQKIANQDQAFIAEAELVIKRIKSKNSEKIVVGIFNKYSVLDALKISKEILEIFPTGEIPADEIIFVETIVNLRKERFFKNYYERIKTETHFDTFMHKESKGIICQILQSYGLDHGVMICEELFVLYPTGEIPEFDFKLTIYYLQTSHGTFSADNFKQYKDKYSVSPECAQAYLEHFERIERIVVNGERVPKMIPRDQNYLDIVRSAYGIALTGAKFKSLLSLFVDFQDRWSRNSLKIRKQVMEVYDEKSIVVTRSLDNESILKVTELLTATAGYSDAPFTDLLASACKDKLNTLDRDNVEIAALYISCLMPQQKRELDSLAQEIKSTLTRANSSDGLKYRQLFDLYENLEAQYLLRINELMHAYAHTNTGKELVEYFRIKYSSKVKTQRQLTFDEARDIVLSRIEKPIKRQLNKLRSELNKFRQKDDTGVLKRPTRLVMIPSLTKEAGVSRASAELSTMEDSESWETENFHQIIIKDPLSNQLVGNVQLHIFDYKGEKSILFRINPNQPLVNRVDRKLLVREIISGCLRFAKDNNLVAYLPNQHNPEHHLTNRNSEEGILSLLESYFERDSTGNLVGIWLEMFIGNSLGYDDGFPMICKRAYKIDLSKVDLSDESRTDPQKQNSAERGVDETLQTLANESVKHALAELKTENPSSIILALDFLYREKLERKAAEAILIKCFSIDSNSTLQKMMENGIDSTSAIMTKEFLQKVILKVIASRILEFNEQDYFLTHVYEYFFFDENHKLTPSAHETPFAKAKRIQGQIIAKLLEEFEDVQPGISKENLELLIQLNKHINISDFCLKTFLGYKIKTVKEFIIKIYITYGYVYGERILNSLAIIYNPEQEKYYGKADRAEWDFFGDTVMINQFLIDAPRVFSATTFGAYCRADSGDRITLISRWRRAVRNVIIGAKFDEQLRADPFYLDIVNDTYRPYNISVEEFAETTGKVRTNDCYFESYVRNRPQINVPTYDAEALFSARVGKREFDIIRIRQIINCINDGLDSSLANDPPDIKILLSHLEDAHELQYEINGPDNNLIINEELLDQLAYLFKTLNDSLDILARARSSMKEVEQCDLSTPHGQFLALRKLTKIIAGELPMGVENYLRKTAQAYIQKKTILIPGKGELDISIDECMVRVDGLIKNIYLELREVTKNYQVHEETDRLAPSILDLIPTMSEESYLARANVRLASARSDRGWQSKNYFQAVLFDRYQNTVQGLVTFNVFKVNSEDLQESVIIRFFPSQTYLQTLDAKHFAKNLIEAACKIALANNLTPYFPTSDTKITQNPTYASFFFPYSETDPSGEIKQINIQSIYLFRSTEEDSEYCTTVTPIDIKKLQLPDEKRQENNLSNQEIPEIESLANTLASLVRPPYYIEFIAAYRNCDETIRKQLDLNETFLSCVDDIVLYEIGQRRMSAASVLAKIFNLSSDRFDQLILGQEIRYNKKAGNWTLIKVPNPEGSNIELNQIDNLYVWVHPQAEFLSKEEFDYLELWLERMKSEPNGAVILIPWGPVNYVNLEAARQIIIKENKEKLDEYACFLYRFREFLQKAEFILGKRLIYWGDKFINCNDEEGGSFAQAEIAKYFKVERRKFVGSSGNNETFFKTICCFGQLPSECVKEQADNMGLKMLTNQITGYGTLPELPVEIEEPKPRENILTPGDAFASRNKVAVSLLGSYCYPHFFKDQGYSVPDLSLDNQKVINIGTGYWPYDTIEIIQAVKRHAPNCSVIGVELESAVSLAHVYFELRDPREHDGFKLEVIRTLEREFGFRFKQEYKIVGFLLVIDSNGKPQSLLAKCEQNGFGLMHGLALVDFAQEIKVQQFAKAVVPNQYNLLSYAVETIITRERLEQMLSSGQNSIGEDGIEINFDPVGHEIRKNKGEFLIVKDIEELPDSEAAIITIFNVAVHMKVRDRSRFYRNLKSKLIEGGLIIIHNRHLTWVLQREGDNLRTRYFGKEDIQPKDQSDSSQEEERY